MRLAVAVLCDSANVRGGTLGVLGAGVNTLWRQEYPAPMLSTLALLIEVPAQEAARTYPVAVRMDRAGEGQESDPIASAEGEFTVESPMDRAAFVPMPIDFSGLELPDRGEYSIRVQIDGVEHTSITFYAEVGSPTGPMP